MKSNLAGFLFSIVCAVSNGATSFEGLEQAFTQAAVPVQTNMRYLNYSGRCVDAAEPTRKVAAVLSGGIVKAQGQFPPSYASFSLYRDPSAAENYFDRFSAKQIREFAPTKAWIDGEKWEAVLQEDGSFVRRIIADGTTTELALRTYEADGSRSWLMRVRAGTEAAHRYCYFTNPLRLTYLVGQTGAIENRGAEMTNATYGYVSKSIYLINGSGAITLEGLLLSDKTGYGYRANRFVPLAPGQILKVDLPRDMQLWRVGLWARGKTSDLKIEADIQIQ